MALDAKQRQMARALGRRRFEQAAELDEAETLQIEPELAPTGGYDWPPILMVALLLAVISGTAAMLIL
jgi:hypothetical protein